MATPDRAPRALLLDLGNVLVTFDHLDACRPLAGPAGMTPEEVHARVFGGGLEARLDRGEVEPEQFATQVLAALGDPPLDVQQVLAAWADIFTRHDANLAALAPLAARYRLVLVSNTNRPHMQRIEAMAPELEAFHARVLSFELGAQKPDPRVYAAALDAAGVPPEACLFVDDGAANVAGARAAGLPAVLHAPGAPLRLEGVWPLTDPDR